MTNDVVCTGAQILKNFVMAGGQGTRLEKLTKDGEIHQRAKPAVRVFGKYRIIDLVLSNLANSGCTNVSVLVQYGAQSLSDYLLKAWAGKFDTLSNVFPQQAVPGNIFHGTADAVRQAMRDPEARKTKYVGIYAGDHITKFNVNPFLQYHVKASAKFTIAVMLIPIERAHQFGIIVADKNGKVTGFQEKPGGKDNPDMVPAHAPGDPTMALASLGNYIVDQDYLIEVLNADPSAHDFGNDVIPAIIGSGNVYAYDMSSMTLPGDEPFFWEDVGSLVDYHRMHMEMCSPIPPLNLYNEEWPIIFESDYYPPARGIGDLESNRIGAHMISGGCQYEGLTLNYGVIGRMCDLRFCTIDHSILFDYVHVGSGCDLQRVIVDKAVSIPPNTIIGRDHKEDEKRGFYVDKESGIVIVPRYYEF